MSLRRTQIYLDPEEHRRLVLEAAQRGLSLTEYLRRVIGNRTGEQSITYDTRSWDRLFSLLDSGSKDSVEAMDEEAAEAFERQHMRSARTTGGGHPRTRPKPRRS